MSQDEKIQTLEALVIARQIIKALLPLQIRFCNGIGEKEQADLDQIDNAIRKLSGT